MDDTADGGPEAGGAIPDAVRKSRIAQLHELLGVVRPVMQADGGDLELVDADVVAGVVRVRLVGACGSCAVSSLTLSGGVERVLRARLDWVTEVLGDVAESEAPGSGGWTPRH